jgi:cholera toxin transcriptional activator
LRAKAKKSVLNRVNWARQMTESAAARRYRFGAFEADASTGELRRQGIKVKLNSQPFQVLLLLLDRPGEVLTREEISRALWPDGIFVDYEHGVNSAVNRIRDALGDSAANPRFVETLARRGYRFVAPVERIGEPVDVTPASEASPPTPDPVFGDGLLASPDELPDTPHTTVRTLFLLLQLMYLGFYVGALANLAEIQELLSPLPAATLIFYALIVSAAVLIAVRTYLLSSVFLRAPGMRSRFLAMWPYLLVADVLWALSPLLLLHHISTGLALAFMAPLVYSPFVQRSLMLMGAGREGK